MSTINRKWLLLTVCLLLLCVPAGYAQEDLLRSDEITPEQINYDTRPVTIGTYEKTASFSASEVYPLIHSISFDHSSARFVSYNVSRGDEVKEGDILAYFTIDASEASLASMELTLENLYKSTERGMRERQAQIADMLEALETTYGDVAREKQLLQLERLVLETERYRFRQQNSIDQQKKALEEANERRETNVLVAPADGIIDDLKFKRPDDPVSAHEVLITLLSTDVQLLYVPDPSGTLRYNMEVTVTVGGNNNRVDIPGRVITADNIVPISERVGFAFVELGEFDREKVRMRNIKISAPTVSIGNVTLAARQAVVLDSGAYYVTKLSNGMVQRRVVEFGGGNAQTAWVLNGVEEGDILIID